MQKTIIITGATSGIGKESVEIFHKNNWKVIATGRNQQKLKQFSDLGITTFLLDVTNSQDIENLVAFIENENIKIDVLLNNAGYGQFGTIEEVPMDLIYKQFETNVFGFARVTKFLLPFFRKNNGGKIINIASIVGAISFPGGGYYSATKFAVEAISDALRYEVKKYGIKVVIIEPGPLSTEFFNVVNNCIPNVENSPYKHLEQLYFYLKNMDKIPILKFGSPIGMAKIIFKAAKKKQAKNRYTYPFSWYLLKKFYSIIPSKIIDFFMVKLFLQ